MTRRVAGQSRRRPPSPPPAAVETPQRWWSRGWKRVTTAILTVGALAAAIGAIVSLWPSPDPEDSAQFTTIRTVSEVPLSEYRQRVEVIGAPPMGLRGYAAPATASGTSSEPTAGATTSEAAAETTTTTSSTTTAYRKRSTASSRSTTTPTPTTTSSSSTTTSPPPTTDPTSSSRGIVLPPGTSYRTYSLTLDAAVDRAVSNGLRVTGADLGNVPYLVVGQSVTADGQPVPPAVAAERVVKVLEDARTGAASGGEEPLGVVVSADVELAGLRGKPVLLNWSMWQAGGSARLHGDWLNRNLAYRMQATTDHDTTTVDLWIPLPKEHGPYLVRIDMTAEGVRLDADESEPID